MIEDYLKEYEYLKSFKSNTGLKQNINISRQVLNNLTRILSVYNLEDSSFNYYIADDKYYKEKEGEKIEINYSAYRINTFMQDYIELQ